MYAHTLTDDTMSFSAGDPQILGDSANRNLMKFYKKKQQLLHMGKKNPVHQDRLGPDCLRSGLRRRVCVLSHQPVDSARSE